MDGGLEALFRENGAINGRVRQAVLHKAERRLLVEAQSDSLLTLGQMEAIRQGLEDAMGCPTQAAFFFCGPAALQLEEQGAALGKVLEQSLRELCPTGAAAAAGAGLLGDAGGWKRPAPGGSGLFPGLWPKGAGAGGNGRRVRAPEAAGKAGF